MTESKTINLKRLAAMLYDGLIIIALLMIATLLILPLNKGIAVPRGNYYYQIYLFLIYSSYFVGFWKKSGQTTGMNAWRIRLVNENDELLSFWQATLRFVIAVPCFLFCGIGFFWCFFNKKHETLYDKIMKTKVISF